MDKLVPALQPSEYGIMPASFSNSQKISREVELDATDINKDTTSEEPSALPTKPFRQPIFPKDDFDGVDSDDETDEEEDDNIDEEEDERPQVVGDIEIDMGEEEAEFLEFSRQALGISDDQWNDIITDRKDRGGMLGLLPVDAG
jgi:hypothetical protein